MPFNVIDRAPITISLGAIAGALSRYYLAQWIGLKLGNDFPYGILIVNLTGCLLMGLIVGLISSRIINISLDLQLMLTSGFLGSYTTFSTYGLDTVNLLEKKSFLIATLYCLGSAIGGVICVKLGIAIGRL